MRTLELQLLRFPYRYECLIGACLLTGLFWPMYGGFQAFMATFVILLVLLDARSASQYKRASEDLTMIDLFVKRIPFRYELLLLLAVVLWGIWWLVAGTTGFMLGLGIIALVLRARSSSQLKHGTAVQVDDVLQ